jgi:hypothetical protein
MRRTLGLAIQKACAIVLRAVLGIRIPAARIRLHDQQHNRAHAAEQFYLATRSAIYWADEITRCDAEIAKADDVLRAMEDHQRRLHIPSPTSPISIL